MARAREVKVGLTPARAPCLCGAPSSGKTVIHVRVHGLRERLENFARALPPVRERGSHRDRSLRLAPGGAGDGGAARFRSREPAPSRKHQGADFGAARRDASGGGRDRDRPRSTGQRQDHGSFAPRARARRRRVGGRGDERRRARADRAPRDAARGSLHDPPPDGVRCRVDAGRDRRRDARRCRLLARVGANARGGRRADGAPPRAASQRTDDRGHRARSARGQRARSAGKRVPRRRHDPAHASARDVLEVPLDLAPLGQARNA